MPNPSFENSTAVMKFYDEFGSKVKTVELPLKGQNAEFILTNSNFEAGIYSYSFVVNGKITDTKNMLRTR